MLPSLLGREGGGDFSSRAGPFNSTDPFVKTPNSGLGSWQLLECEAEEACVLHRYIIFADFIHTEIHTGLGAGLQIREAPEKRGGERSSPGHAPAVGLSHRPGPGCVCVCVRRSQGSMGRGAWRLDPVQPGALAGPQGPTPFMTAVPGVRDLGNQNIELSPSTSPTLGLYLGPLSAKGKAVCVWKAVLSLSLQVLFDVV